MLGYPHSTIVIGISRMLGTSGTLGSTCPCCTQSNSSYKQIAFSCPTVVLQDARRQGLSVQDCSKDEANAPPKTPCHTRTCHQTCMERAKDNAPQLTKSLYTWPHLSSTVTHKQKLSPKATQTVRTAGQKG